jgi:hypothetical protein
MSEMSKMSKMIKMIKMSVLLKDQFVLGKVLNTFTLGVQLTKRQERI